MVSLKSKIHHIWATGMCRDNMFDYELDEKGEWIKVEDIRDAFRDYTKWLKVIHWRRDHIGVKDSKYIKSLITELTKKYKCKFYELGFEKIFGDWG